MSEKAFATYSVREVAAVFRDVTALEQAVERLTQEGFADGDFNIMATDETVREKLKDHLEPVEVLADDPHTPRRAFVPRPSRKLAEAAVVGAPMFILGAAGALGVVATGGAAALALAAAAAGGTLGAGLGATLAAVLETLHAQELARAMEAGGVVLWVRTADDQAENTAIRVLKACGGEHVHAHVIERTWGPEDIPLSDFNPDPFLEPDPEPKAAEGGKAH
ncbi:hypothetical protein SAMN05216257_106120 [Meinhardsimonia xiamenensis]|uniref:Uncharacterized protein n=1 Tax=Meinhardsimonia xiamenensis TaxID=990712 RepID=A0A1G9G6F0_9RHOB|nr:hypothetical protein [Meinhardsimonia xiamenensis]PRX32657.1 hypothetical protein LV81_02418 [Meinhardsimonia xiamenensis]SDK96318.1 hypothetical protein SAMN05216257_106120 [Meinhardsimonia xiamenensis]